MPRVSVSFGPRRTKGVGDHILASPVLLVFRRGGGEKKIEITGARDRLNITAPQGVMGDILLWALY